MDALTFAVISVCAAAAAVAALLILRNMRKEAAGKFPQRARRPSKKRQGEDVCGICFGPISKEDMMAKCSCGQVFHDTCARPTGKCPYCASPYGDLKVDAPDYVRCPACGSDVVGNVCSCGALVNRDGTFTCSCGTPVDVNDPKCRKCGREYDVARGGAR